MTNQKRLFEHLYGGEDAPLLRPYNFKGFIGPPKFHPVFIAEPIESVLADLAKRYSNPYPENKAA